MTRHSERGLRRAGSRFLSTTALLTNNLLLGPEPTLEEISDTRSAGDAVAAISQNPAASTSSSAGVPAEAVFNGSPFAWYGIWYGHNQGHHHA